jgi:hypothetical protein
MRNKDLMLFLHQYGHCQEARLTRHIIPHSVPIFWFGDRKAQVATIGINCGPEEFNPQTSTAQHWGKKSHINHHNYGDYLDLVIAHLDSYFSHSNSCQKVFWSKWEALLNLADVSYYQSPMTRAYHIDLLPWATGDVWSSLPKADQAEFLKISHIARDIFFKNSSAKIFLCQGRTVTETAGPALGFWSGRPPWIHTGSSRFIVQKHPQYDKWLVGWNRWYYSAEDQQLAAHILNSLLHHQPIHFIPPRKNRGPIQMTDKISNPTSQNIIELFQNEAERHWPEQDLFIKEAADWNGLFATSHKNRKLLTVFKNSSTIEFDRSCILDSERQVLECDFDLKNTWNTVSHPQLRLDRLDTQKINSNIQIFRNIFERIVRRHPHFKAA